MEFIKDMVRAFVELDKVHIHSLETVPLALDAVAFTIQVPADALVLVYIELVTPALDWTGVPLIYQLTFAVWLNVILNDLIDPAISFTGDTGA